MNCRRCHHTSEVHADDEPGASLVGAGKCNIPVCTCRQYLDPIRTIDEDIM